MKKSSILLSAALALAACNSPEEVVVHADFQTDKEVYQLGESVRVTNTTTVDHSRIAICKWEWAGKVSYETVPEGIRFDAVGSYPLTLTVTADDDFVKGTVTKDIIVEDNNIRPLVDFSWTPADITAGDEVTFTADCSDPDGEIVSYEWDFAGTKVVTKETVVRHSFAVSGEVAVSLKAVDNLNGSTTLTKTLMIQAGETFLSVKWAEPYEAEDYFVLGSSPAVSPDGKHIYVASSGLHLVSFDTEGNQEWSFDFGDMGNGVRSVSEDANGSHAVPTVTPSVDADGNIYIAGPYNNPKNYIGGVFSVTPDGKKRWFSSFGTGASFRFFSPMIVGDYVVILDRDTESTSAFSGENFNIVYREGGTCYQSLYINGGPYGGLGALSNNILVANSGNNRGRVYYPDPDQPGKWAATRTDKSHWVYAGGKNGLSSQLAVTPDDKVIFLANEGMSVHCVDLSGYTFASVGADVKSAWSTTVKGSITLDTGIGAVLGEDGTIYVTTSDPALGGARSGAWVTALSKDGAILWERKADNYINGVAAIDNEGYIYYLDTDVTVTSLGAVTSGTAKLVKLDTAGNVVAEVLVGQSALSSPTIADDGTVYVNSMQGGRPTLFAVTGTATGRAKGWSQLGGNPRKTEHVTDCR